MVQKATIWSLMMHSTCIVSNSHVLAFMWSTSCVPGINSFICYSCMGTLTKLASLEYYRCFGMQSIAYAARGGYRIFRKGWLRILCFFGYFTFLILRSPHSLVKRHFDQTCMFTVWRVFTVWRAVIQHNCKASNTCGVALGHALKNILQFWSSRIAAFSVIYAWHCHFN